MEQFKRELNGTFEMSVKTKEFLLHYSWPGNIRELHNAVEYFNYTGKEVVELADLPPTMKRERSDGAIGRRTDSQVPGTEVLRAFDAWARHPYWFVLEQLYLASEQGIFIGREKLYQTAKERKLPISQKQIRDCLKEMTDQGFVVAGRGRGGSRITPEGRACWEEQVQGKNR